MNLKFFMISATLLISLNACQAKSDQTITDTPEATHLSTPTSSDEINHNPNKDAYFGDTHVHTKNSFDAFIVGTRSNADDAYRFAKGETIDNGEGHQIKLDGPPLDFYAVTDHGEYMGVIAAMQDKKSPISRTKTAKSIFGLFGGSHEDRRNAFLRIGVTVVTGDEIEDIYDREGMSSLPWNSSEILIIKLTQLLQQQLQVPLTCTAMLFLRTPHLSVFSQHLIALTPRTSGTG